MAVRFMEGQEVEVASTEEGLEGAWYIANIVRPIKRKKLPLYVVDYQTLTDETEDKPLREIIPASNIRPRQPPEDTRLFELNEEVDAYVNDGWWQGLVIKFLDENRYVVLFTYTKEQMEFGQSDLRTHMEWNQGAWFQPQQSDKIEAVEVCFDDEYSRGAWFPANVLKKIRAEQFLIEYKSLRCSDNVGIQKEIVDSRHVRPPPPNYSASQSFDLEQNVDAFYDFGWWSGVITKVLAENRYTIFFNHQNEEKEFNQSELRLHMEWIDEKWLHDCRETFTEHTQGGIVSLIPSAAMESQPTLREIKDALKRKSPSSPGNSSQVMTPSPTSNYLTMIKLPDPISAEASKPYKKFKKGVATKNSTPMRACHTRGASSGNPTVKEAQHDIIMPVQKSKSSKKFQRKGRGSSISLIKGYFKDDDASPNTKSDLVRDIPSNREKMETIVPKECPGSTDRTAEGDLLSSSKTAQPQAIASSIKTSTKGRAHKQSGGGKPAVVQALSASGRKHKTSRGRRPKALASSIKLSTEGPGNEEDSRKEIVDIVAWSENAELSKCSAKDHLPLLEMQEKSISPTGENNGESQESQLIQNEVITNGGEQMESLELQTSLAFLDQINFECDNEIGDEQNGTGSSLKIDATKQGAFTSTDLAEALNHNAEKDSVMLAKSSFPPEEESTGVTPEDQIVPTEVLTGEVASIGIQELQNSSVVECPKNLDEHTILLENNHTQGKEQTEAALQSLVPEATTSTFSSSPRQGCEGVVQSLVLDSTTRTLSSSPRQGPEEVVPGSLPFLKSPPLSSMWETIDSLNVFKSLPQKPHFLRLEQYNKELREGMALGYMVCLANIADKMRTTTLDEPQSSLEAKLTALHDLEEVGLTVHPIQSRLKELLNIKEKYRQLEDVSKEVEKEIAEEKQKNERLEAEIDELQKALDQVKKRLQLVLAEKDMKESQVAALERKITEVGHSIQGLHHDFDCTVAAPW